MDGPSREYLLKRFDYRNGELFWRTGRRVGKRAGCLNPKGYYVVKLDGKTMLVHRIIYAMFTGEWPDLVDHKNTIRNDNRIRNLRSASRALNSANSKKIRGKVPIRGVSKHKHYFKSSIKVHGESRHLGYFATAKEAAKAYREARAAADTELA